MARICFICGKRRSVGHSVSHANNKSKRVWEPNLQKVKAIIDGTVRSIRVCTRCIRSNRVQKVA
ncbi:MAG: 50S ribosomal protein L28 [bacterium]